MNPAAHLRRAEADDLPALAHLLCWHHHDRPPTRADVEDFLPDLTTWWDAHHRTHHAVLAEVTEGDPVGVAWVALLPRVPRPTRLDRLCADVQSVFVVPEHRGSGLGSALVDAATAHAVALGAARVTVHSSSRAVPVYERLGFSSSPQLLERYADP